MSRRARRPKPPRRMLKASVTVDLRPADLSHGKQATFRE
jgi:hypothetical protein